MNIQLKRVYSPVEEEDGMRILVDRVWPRGVSKEKLQADIWLKEAAPSSDLRKWFNHERAKWQAFKEKYFSELKGKPETVNELLDLAGNKRLTLLFAARDEECNHAVALKEYLLSVSTANQDKI